jgi:hypothetical protein
MAGKSQDSVWEEAHMMYVVGYNILNNRREQPKSNGPQPLRQTQQHFAKYFALQDFRAALRIQIFF